MMAIAHASIAAAGTSLVLGTANPLILGLSVSRYLILGNEAKEFIVSDGQGIYKTNEQIVVKRLTTDIGEGV